MVRINAINRLAWFSAALLFLASCAKDQSSVTGWGYNDPKNGGFEVVDYAGQATGPGLVLIEGGTFVMGNTEEDVMFDWETMPRRTTVSSFYMDETEVANVHYREYEYWLKRVFGADYPEVVVRALPDTLVWRDELAYNEPYVQYYYRHPAYNYYPVVGVSWLQATDFCIWRTDRVNENILIQQGILNINPNQINEDNFNTDAYLVGQYEGDVRKNLRDLDPNSAGERRVRMEDGILLPAYRLPTEAEWEFAAKGLVGNQPYKDEERYTDNRIYPWNGTSSRYPKHGMWQGDFLANFMRGRGDYMGLAGALNDNADITAPVKQFMPNDYGLYNMAGNVNEWVMDVYRPMTFVDMNDFRSFRGNDYTMLVEDSDGIPVEKDSLGRLTEMIVPDQLNENRRNYRNSQVRDFLDGDENSWTEYRSGISTLVDDRARIYKGGSWKDRAYWIAPGARRFLDEALSTDDIGFRCAMDRIGSPEGNSFRGGKSFPKR